MISENNSSVQSEEGTKTENAGIEKSNTHDRYLCFALGHEEYAIPLLSVREVIALPEITPVPQSAGYFLGIMNLRGQVISIIDLRVKLSIKPSEGSETAVIICDLHPNSIGVVVDSINSVINPSPNTISEKPELQGQRNSDYIQAVCREKEKLILLLDISKTLGSGDYQAVARAINSQQKAKAV